MSEEENFRSSLQRGTRASSASFINQVTKSESSHSQNQSEISQRDVTTLQSVNELENHGFSIGKKLNSGSFSRVHQAKHNNVDCAVKIINLGMATSNFIYKLLPREIVILKKLNHPNIIFLHEIFLIQPNLYIFMELADGGDLLDFIVSKGALTEAKAKEWFKQIGDALSYCHKFGVAHRDIKCENLLINRGSIKLTDFGFACIIYDTETRRKLMSTTYCGSISYVPPEILLNVPYDPTQSDIWSLGVVLYVMLNNQLPFESGNLTEIVKSQISNNWSFSADKFSVLSREAKDLIKSMLKPDPRLRPSIVKIMASKWLTGDENLAESLSQCETTETKEEPNLSIPSDIIERDSSHVRDRDRVNREDKLDSDEYYKKDKGKTRYKHTRDKKDKDRKMTTNVKINKKRNSRQKRKRMKVRDHRTGQESRSKTLKKQQQQHVPIGRRLSRTSRTSFANKTGRVTDLRRVSIPLRPSNIEDDQSGAYELVRRGTEPFLPTISSPSMLSTPVPKEDSNQSEEATESEIEQANTSSEDTDLAGSPTDSTLEDVHEKSSSSLE